MPSQQASLKAKNLQRHAGELIPKQQVQRQLVSAKAQ
jgi:hypothetical protein